MKKTDMDLKMTAENDFMESAAYIVTKNGELKKTTYPRKRAWEAHNQLAEEQTLPR